MLQARRTLPTSQQKHGTSKSNINQSSLAEVQVHPGWGVQQEITVGAQVKVKLGEEHQEWEVEKANRMIQIRREDRTLEVERGWFFYDTESKSFRLQQMGFFYGSYRQKLTPETNSIPTMAGPAKSGRDDDGRSVVYFTGMDDLWSLSDVGAASSTEQNMVSRHGLLGMLGI